MPVDPPICSEECWDVFEARKELETIIHTFHWIKVKRYTEPKEMTDPRAIVDWEYAYKALNEHHTKETEFLIGKVRELAQQLLDGGITKTGGSQE